MLREEISNIKVSFETIDAIIEALNINIQKYEDIKDFCSGIKCVECESLKNHINILIKCNFVENDNQCYFLKNSFSKERFIKRFLKKIIYEKIIDINKIKNDGVRFFISNSTIKLEYSGVRNFLLEEKIFIYNHNNVENDELVFEIAEEYVNHFKEKDKEMTLEELDKILDLEKTQGKMAEDFVVQYERDRLGKNNEDKIQKVSEENVMLGYDIVSIKSLEELEKIYIEVKSYSGEKLFLTSNEIEVAQRLRDYYYLYIVDIKNINEKDYKPYIIKNPYKEIINNYNISKRIEILSIKIDEIC